MARGNEAATAAERVARESYGRLVAYLASRTGSVAAAEDMLSAAFVAALSQWPKNGVPEQPEGWLLEVARRRHADTCRHTARSAKASADVRRMDEELRLARVAPNALPDERLALMYACAHPELPDNVHTALMLQTILGLTAQEIAAAFRTSASAIGQRLARAKRRARELAVSIDFPADEELTARTPAVLAAVYAAYTTGWRELGEPSDTGLASEAIWLARLLARLAPEEPEAKGVLALMLYSHSRRGARIDANGEFVPLDQQDPSLWERAMFDEAEATLGEANRRGATGRYQLEAALQSAQMVRIDGRAPNRDAIAEIYRLLEAVAPSPVVSLNCIAARIGIAPPHQLIEELQLLTVRGNFDDYQPYWVVRAHLAFAAGSVEDGHGALRIAMGLSTSPAIRKHLQSLPRRLRK